MPDTAVYGGSQGERLGPKPLKVELEILKIQVGRQYYCWVSEARTWLALHVSSRHIWKKFKFDFADAGGLSAPG